MVAYMTYGLQSNKPINPGHTEQSRSAATEQINLCPKLL